ncbi:MAG: PCRF domain-containing protein, partial [Planctomycetia bacterium]|nr:PCRF domain-containing protein [Planctomycetia bacterium]
MAQPGFWDRQEAAQAKVQEMKGLTAVVRPMDELLKSGDDIGALVEMAEEDDSLTADLRTELDQVLANVEQQELKAMLSGPHDRGPALVTINARDGGTDANDWAEMLLRMYILWSEDRDYEVEILDRQDNEQAG